MTTGAFVAAAGASTSSTLTSYVLGSDANFVFPNAIYSAPAGAYANFTFEVGVLRVWGIHSTTFGTPAILVGQHTGSLLTQFGAARANFRASATGEAPTTAFGEPRWGVVKTATGATPSTTFGTAAIEPHAMPINSTVFGTPNSPYLQTGVVDGFLTTTISAGHRLAGTHYALSFGSSTQIPQAYYASAQAETATGQVRTRFGTPGLQPTTIIAENVTAQASGASTTVFGTATAPRTQTAVGSGFRSTILGWPRGTQVFAFTIFGSPSALMTATAQGATTTIFGTPVMALSAAPMAPTTVFGTPTATDIHVATSLPRRTRFGYVAAFPGGHRAYGINLERRFGQPSATNRINRPATGWTESALGTPVCAQRHRVPHMAPTTTFGAPLLNRSPEC